MTISQETPFLSEVKSDAQISKGNLAYLKARVRNNFYDYVVRKFLEAEQKDGLKRVDLAERIGWRQDVLSRKLNTPGNWTLDTVTELLVGICREELVPDSSPILAEWRRIINNLIDALAWR